MSDNVNNVSNLVRVAIAIPTQEMARSADFYDWVDLIEPPNNVELLRCKSHGQSPARNRNIMIRDAINTNCDYIFFVDDDCLVPPNTLKKLMSHDLDIVTGLYCMRNYPHRPIIFDIANDDGTCAWANLETGDRGLKEIVATGMGCLLVKMDVLKKIAETEKYWVTLGELEADHWCDDLAFFKRVRKAGYKIYADLDCPVGHVAKATIWPNKINEKWNITYDTSGTDRVNIPMEVVKRMRGPSDRRQTTWLEGVMQIHITNVCDLSCPSCSQGCNTTAYPQSMSLEQFERAVISVKDYYGVIGVYGGNPTLHAKFPEICEILRKYIPFEKRGLFTNGLSGHGKICAETFNPAYSNLNIHAQLAALEDFNQDWRAALPFVKGYNHSRHTPVWVAMKDLEDMTDKQRKELILDCDINRHWSAMIGLFRGDIRAWFCEIAGAQSRLHEDDESYPDTGLPVSEGWWKYPITKFEHQINKHCFECGIPLRAFGEMDNGQIEYVSKTHLPIYNLKRPKDKIVKVITKRSELGKYTLPRSTDYIENGLLAMVTK